MSYDLIDLAEQGNVDIVADSYWEPIERYAADSHVTFDAIDDEPAVAVEAEDDSGDTIPLTIYAQVEGLVVGNLQPRHDVEGLHADRGGITYTHTIGDDTYDVDIRPVHDL